MRDEEELPEGWRQAPIGDVVLPVPNAKPEARPDREFGYVDISSIDNSRFKISDPKRIAGADAPSRARRPIRPGDVLFSNVRTYLRNIALVPSELDVTFCSTGFTVLRPGDAVTSGFLFRYVLTDDFHSLVEPEQTGTHYPAVSDKAVLAQRIPLPPLPEQARIVAKLEALLARVESACRHLKGLPALLSSLRQAIVDAGFSGSLSAEWRDARRKSISRSEKPRPQEPVGECDELGLPAGWIWVRLGGLIAEGPQNGLYRPRSDYGIGTPIVRINDFQGGVLRSRDELLKLSVSQDDLQLFGLRPGDVLVNRVNSPSHLGKSLVVPASACPAVFESNMMRFSVSNTIDTRFLGLYLNSLAGRKRLTANAKWAVNQASINQGDVRATLIPLPSTEEQREIVRRVEALFALADAIERRVASASARADKLTQAILAKAFRGELVPTEAELNRRREAAAATPPPAVRPTAARPAARRSR